MKNLYTRMWVRLVALTVVMGLLLFVLAGTMQYWQAWVYLTIFMGASVLISLYLIKKDPELLRRRMRGGPTAEKETTQKIIMLLASMGFIALLVVPALDYRFGWSVVPLSVVTAGDTLVAIGSISFFLCTRRIHSQQRLSKSLKIRRSSLPGHMRWCATRCTQVDCCTLLARRLRSPRTGGGPQS